MRGKKSSDRIRVIPRLVFNEVVDVNGRKFHGCTNPLHDPKYPQLIPLDRVQTRDMGDGTHRPQAQCSRCRAKRRAAPGRR